jgi:hypothetical protein
VTQSTILRDLGNGLVLRRATAADTDALVRFNSIIHSSSSEPDPYVAGHTFDLITGRLPTFQAGDFSIIEDTASGKIVSSMSLIGQEWAYEGIPFKVGRPEIVGTDPEYRRRGLVRIQFDEVHQWSQERGELVQVITGLPWYYRQFGYELAINLDGYRRGCGPNVPRLADGQPEPVTVRQAGPGDLALIARLYDRAVERQPVHVLRDAALWRYELDGRSETNLNLERLHIIEKDGQPAGFLALSPRLWGKAVWLTWYELENAAWHEATPAVLRFLWSEGQRYAARDGEACEMFGVELGEAHPVYDLFPECLPRVNKPGACYLRVADMPGFVRRIAPALERRLACSNMGGFTGPLKLNFYRSGMFLSFESGRLAKVEGCIYPQDDWWDSACFPDLTFLQLLFGYRSLADLTYAFADCFVYNRRSAALVEALFPKRPSYLWLVG